MPLRWESSNRYRYQRLPCSQLFSKPVRGDKSRRFHPATCTSADPLERYHDEKQRHRRARPRWKLHRSKHDRSADGSTDSDGSEEISKEHKLASLSILTGKAHLQRACVKCKPTFRKASYYCKSCCLEFVLCGPTTGRLCYQHHLQVR